VIEIRSSVELRKSKNHLLLLIYLTSFIDSGYLVAFKSWWANVCTLHSTYVIIFHHYCEQNNGLIGCSSIIYLRLIVSRLSKFY
jgi:hypothetical protein